MVEAFTYEWDVLPQVIAEVRRRTLYPFKPAGPETDAELTENLTTVLGAAFRDSEPIGCVAVLHEPKHDCLLRVRWLGVEEAMRGKGIIHLYNLIFIRTPDLLERVLPIGEC